MIIRINTTSPGVISFDTSIISSEGTIAMGSYTHLDLT